VKRNALFDRVVWLWHPSSRTWCYLQSKSAFSKQLAKHRFSYKWPGLWSCRKVSLSKLKIYCPL